MHQCQRQIRRPLSRAGRAEASAQLLERVRHLGAARMHSRTAAAIAAGVTSDCTNSGNTERSG